MALPARMMTTMSIRAGIKTAVDSTGAEKARARRAAKAARRLPTKRPERTERSRLATVLVLGGNASKDVSDYPIGVFTSACVMT